MKYWGYFAAKVAAAGALMWALWIGLNAFMPEPDYFLRYRVSKHQDLTWVSAILVYWLLCVGLTVAILMDQRHRCRTCLRRLRMPVERGSWSFATLLNPPEMERICPFGHGTLAEPQVHSSTTPDPVWTPHDDIWKELEQFDSRDA